ncbi:DNA repair protein RAD51 homolog 2 [Xyrauchen texanus]|uniref:DNA repair protein RAD51 homolog 2 n=1 Tax=Xyrauchen texanus TaxID=154827 RepID=UPI002241B241|nr:DNA repair protein RAD51 homolog 2 [Xyrauchen texanus]XP_051952205.1 DNA repair protein RAD51 homolog 2 [Xyrauchen texanus]XP_051952206.1 DNA repair protein RAD51 homolog 2 [Xyrauchen texanus]XP_051952207.1 DNA repair protein RAD51 homolog 2 [Xyrauchen texanus]XP_051952208.1 DNA repair protein RAD51 homolog 2 [Xyrauchen texanus]
MASKKLRRSGVSADLCDRLKRHQVETCQDLLSITPLELMRLAGLSYSAVLDLQRLVSKACVPAVTTALDLWRKKGELCFSTSLPALDRLLQGGLPQGALTEVTGPSGCGKTQFCIMLSLLATLPKSMGGLDSGVIYIDTESAFSAERLIEMAQTRFPEYFSVKERVLEMASRVHLFRELTCQDVLNRLERLEEDIIACRAGLLILDSVASVVRKEFDTSLPGNLIHRSNLLGQEAAMLKYLAQEFCIPVVLTNQITTHVGEKVHYPQRTQSDGSSEESSGFITAALGNTWSHSVNTRLIVQYKDSEQRQIVIAKSPVAPFAMLSYTVQREGICLHGDDNPESFLNQGTDPGLQPIRVRTGLSYNLSQAMPSTC